MYRGSLNGGLLLNLAEAEEEAGPVVGIVDDIRECSEIICTSLTFENMIIFLFVEIVSISFLNVCNKYVPSGSYKFIYLH